MKRQRKSKGKRMMLFLVCSQKPQLLRRCLLISAGVTWWCNTWGHNSKTTTTTCSLVASDYQHLLHGSGGGGKVVGAPRGKMGARGGGAWPPPPDRERARIGIPATYGGINWFVWPGRDERGRFRPLNAIFKVSDQRKCAWVTRNYSVLALLLLLAEQTRFLSRCCCCCCSCCKRRERKGRGRGDDEHVAARGGSGHSSFRARRFPARLYTWKYASEMKEPRWMQRAWNLPIRAQFKRTPTYVDYRSERYHSSSCLNINEFTASPGISRLTNSAGPFKNRPSAAMDLRCYCVFDSRFFIQTGDGLFSSWIF